MLHASISIIVLGQSEKVMILKKFNDETILPYKRLL